ncbi:MAG: MTAP family purine nucleoside phosphorylase [Armatimonadota bacterium]|nr:MTAP family purine nucleoside phosphorylase [bacterium]
MPNNKLIKNYALIAGSNGYKLVEKLGNADMMGSIETPFGKSSPVYATTVSGTRLFVISRHGESGYSVSAPFVNYRANIWALKELGVQRIVAWSGPGAIDPSISIGDILVPGDIIDETKGRAYTFFEGLGIGFIRQNPVFCPQLAASLARVIEKHQGHCRTSDVYICTQGPRLETRAEIKKFAAFGGTLVGMTLVPEAFLAKELEMCYCPVCYVTNYAEGVIERDYQPGKLFEGLLSDEEKSRVDASVTALPSLIIEALASVPESPECRCGLSMERYRRRGDIGEDWHSWIQPQTPQSH